MILAGNSDDPGGGTNFEAGLTNMQFMLQLMNVQQIMPIQSERQPIAMVTYKSGVPYDIEQEQIGKQDKESAGPDCATICRPQDFFLNMSRTKRKRKLVEWLESCQENQVRVLDEKIPLLSFAVDFVTAYEYQKARGIKIHPGLWKDMRVDIFSLKKKIEKVVEKIRFAVLLCIRRFQTSEKVNSVLCCTVLGKQRHDWIPRACQDARKHIAWLQSDARQSAGKGCLSGICRGRETHSYNDRSCRGGNTSTALLCRYGMTLDLLFESVNGNIIIRMRNRP